MIANAGSDASRVLDAGAVVEFRENGDELIAAQTCHGIRFTHTVADALRRLHQQLVAGGVSQRVVNFLESVKVKEQHRLI